MKKLFTLCAIVLILSQASSLQAQSQIRELQGAKGEKLKLSNTWSSLLSQPNLTVNYKLSDCNDIANGLHKEYVSLELVNPLNRPIVVEWDMALWYSGKCMNCDFRNQEMHHSVTVQPGGHVFGDCSNRGNQALNIFSKHLDLKDTRSSLTFFQLNNLTVR